jgi:hypothetical protein
MRFLGVMVVALSLVAAVAGGLLRACLAPVPDTTGAWLVSAAAHHAALMIGGFLGTVVALERAVALRNPAAFLAPAASGLGGLMILASRPEAAAWSLVTAGVAFVVVNVLLLKRQDASHTRLLLAGAGAWLAGSVCLATGDAYAAIPWWFAFLVATIAAERLEMTRLTPRGAHVEPLLWNVAAMLFGGAALSPVSSALGSAMFGAALVGLSLWLFAFDIARHILSTEGLSRYMAICLLAGYAWLAIAGVAWSAMGAGLPTRDAALHALGLGFVVSMMMAHAPVILPALTRIRLRFGAMFYVPLATLHVSLLVRLVAGYADPLVRGLGAALNALALILFALTIVASAIGSRVARRTRLAKARTF